MPESLLTPLSRADADGDALHVPYWRNERPQAPAILLAHANGFCAAVWSPIAEALAQHYTVIAYDARGHGRSRTRVEPQYLRWEVLHADMIDLVQTLSAMRRLAVPRVNVVGHSMGGMTAVCAAAKAPACFDRLVLLDPLVWWPEMRERRRSQDNKSRMAQGARRRRAQFDSRAAAYAAWRQRESFRDWDEAVFKAYLEYGLVPNDDGFQLACAPATEARLFEAHWDEDLRELAGRVECGGEVIHASNGHFPAAFHTELAEIVPGLDYVEFAGSHFFPMEQPEVTADMLRAAITRGEH